MFDRGFDVTTDGTRFVMARLATREAGEASVEIVVVDQWEGLLGE